MFQHVDPSVLDHGKWMQAGFAELAHFVLPVTAATLLHASPAQMGLLAAAQTAPALLFGLHGGVVADL